MRAILVRHDIASVIRSKNAGPRALTLDVMFADDAGYARAAQSRRLPRRVSWVTGRFWDRKKRSNFKNDVRPYAPQQTARRSPFPCILGRDRPR